MLQAVLLPVSRLLLRLPHNSDLNMCGRPPSIQATELELSRGCGTPKPVWDVSLFHLGTLKFLKLIFIFSFMMGLHSPLQPVLRGRPLWARSSCLGATEQPRQLETGPGTVLLQEPYLLTIQQWPPELCFFLVLLCRGSRRQTK